MTNDETVELCMRLVQTDHQEDVIAILEEAGYWDAPELWRPYGDYENNYNTIGNQQSRSDAALVEKLVNSIDARLMNECMCNGIDPESESAPRSIRLAVAHFFDGKPDPETDLAGRIAEWPTARRTDVARGITLAATGARPSDGSPCFTIADIGEGQTPNMMPATLLSLTKSNKVRIPFVQGKFNMGGSGALEFCGEHNLQLVLSRRNPAFLSADSDPSDMQWGLTIVRRERPHGAMRNSVYTYLAPVGADTSPRQGGVLRFSKDELHVLPTGQNAYARPASWGTVIKLYEYEATGYSNTHMFLKSGLQSRLDLLLPDAALPVRLHECRAFRGVEERSFETTLSGLNVRLSDDRAKDSRVKNLEDGFPSSAPMKVRGEEMSATIYAFKKGRAETYRKNEGIIFTVNGQMHGQLTQDFFRRKKVGLSYIADSILVVVDCTDLTSRAKEDLFMNSRDRLSGGRLRKEIEVALEDLLKKHETLGGLKNRRREEEIEEKLDDSKPLEDILESLLKQSPALASLFVPGARIKNPFKTKAVASKDVPFEGKRYPTYFHFKGKSPGETITKNCHINMRCRVTFETDAVNEYFSRRLERGEFVLLLSNGERLPVEDYVGPNLQNGIGTLSVRLPEACSVGDRLTYVARVSDPSRIEPFENTFSVEVQREGEPKGKRGKRRRPPADEDGGEREIPVGIALPHIQKVYEADWDEHTPPFDKYTALRIRHAGTQDEGGEERDAYDFFINADNVYLKSELKGSVSDMPLVEARFVYGMVLVSIAILQRREKAGATNGERRASDTDGEEGDQENQVESITRAIAPVLLPMIDGLGGLETEVVTGADTSGEAD